MKNISMPVLAFLLLAACHKQGPSEPIASVEADEKLPGGANGTAYNVGKDAFGIEVKGLTAAEQGYFVTGNSFFRANWVTAPASVQSLDGLGPIFNAISCGSCHFKDGRAQPPNGPGEVLNGLLFRLSIPGLSTTNGPLGDPVYGTQLQDKSILNVEAEGLVNVDYEDVVHFYPDGSTYTLRQPTYTFLDLKYGDFSAGWMYSPRIAPQVPGLGLLEIVAEADILEWSDEHDQNGDGISGRPNYVWNVSDQTSTLGRFGWKANQPNLLQQTAGAFNGDIGITNNLFPTEHFTEAQQQLYTNIPNGGTPELENDILNKVVSYMRTLSVPVRRNYDDAIILRGKYLFQEIKCASCHRPSFTTGNGGEIEALRYQKIWPYSDLLLHDMGPELADGRPDFLATGTEWRTPPLWGIGLLNTVNGHTTLLHDGRARNIEEAILWHGGEAKSSKEQFIMLNADEREALIKFVESL